MFDSIKAEMARIFRHITAGAGSSMTFEQFLEVELSKWKRAKRRRDMLTGRRYYEGDHDILKRKRTIIGADGLLVEVENLPNNRIVDNQYSLMVDQKSNYLVGKPLTFDTENKRYEQALKAVFNASFQRTLKNVGEGSLNGGLAWLYPYYDERGQFRFRRFESSEILPFWRDAEHTILHFALRLYEVEAYEGRQERILEKVELFTDAGIYRFDLVKGKLVPDAQRHHDNYIVLEQGDGTMEPYNWGKIPLIAFKCNNREIPLINRVKSLQDGINIMLSEFENNMQEDSRNTIIVLKNYDGTNLGEFRHNLATYGAVKVKTVEGSEGSVETLTVEVNADNYKAILDLFGKALIKNAHGYDAKDDRMGSNPNQMNIQSMYSDIDLDANGMETEYQAAFHELLYFVNAHLANTGVGDFSSEELTVIFNRDILVNESESIENCAKSVGILSNESIVGQHPWTSDVNRELKRIEREKADAMDEYAQAFGQFPTLEKEGGDRQRGGAVNE